MVWHRKDIAFAEIRFLLQVRRSQWTLDSIIKAYFNGNVPVLILGPASVTKSQVTEFATEDFPKDSFVHNIAHVTPVTTSSSYYWSFDHYIQSRLKVS